MRTRRRRREVRVCQISRTQARLVLHMWWNQKGRIVPVHRGPKTKFNPRCTQV
ncbi:ORF3 [Coconut foliar decay alphasatellite]|uniref:ORF3 n=1 Tax=Coconut foliar decay alphasatellite 1 TaxID=2161874 RepID=Q66008_9VIRU|nr:ORF3 [Coconut foliar decay alphasatellite]AAA42897.1 ORF3 [Coconut foliar decay virus]